MPTWFQRPENALKRANELLEVGKKLDALTALHDIIKSRRHRTWTKVHEQIMTKHLELCVELRKPHIAKDGLFQYRNMCQQVNVKSLETVICAFLANAEKRAAEAKAESKDLVEDVAEDLDQAESPETLLLKAVSGEDAQDRADRTVLSPWLKFLWESYRQCLELLRNNIQVEQLYHKIAKQAFQFCLNYQRRAEFKKLCDNLRTHLNQLQKMQNQSYAAKLSNVETIALHQETRLTQLEVAIKMELWQEAFKSIEDLHNLQPSKYKPKPQVMSNYYEKLALVFWKAGNTLFHAAALYKLYLLHREMKKTFNQEEATLLATRVVLSVLSITTVGSGTPSDMSRHLDMEEQHLEQSRRLSGLLSMSAPPTRNSLIKEIIRFNVIASAIEPAQKLHHWLETDFHPLSLAKNVQEQLVAVEATENPDFTQYIDTMKRVASVKLLKQVSQVYQTISIKRLGEIIPFMDAFSLERMMVTMTKKSQLKVRVDHRQNCFILGAIDMTVGDQDDTYAADSASQGASADDEAVNGVPSSDVRHHLQQVYTALSDSVVVVDSTMVDKIKENMFNQIEIQRYHNADRLDHVKDRKKRIDHYIKDAEEKKRSQEKAQHEEERQMLEKRQKEEEQRLEREREENEVKNKQQEKERVMKQIMTDRLKRLQSSESGRKVINEIGKDQLENLDTETLLQKQVSQMERERRDLQSKLKQQERKWDHLIRAYHTENIKLWQEHYEANQDKDREIWEEYEKERCIRAEKDQQMKIETSKRLERVAGNAQIFLERVRVAHQDDLKERLKEFENLLVEKRAERLKERKEVRKQQRKQEHAKKQEEEKQRREQMDEQRRKAEEDRANNLYVPPTRLGEGPADRGRGDDRSGRRDLSPVDESRTEGNWRRSAPVQPQQPVRDPRPDQAPVREPMRAEPVVAPADSESSWRRATARPAVPAAPVREVAPAPSESVSSWRRGPLPSAEPQQPAPAASPTPPAPAPAKNVWVRGGGARAPAGDRPPYRVDDSIAPAGRAPSERHDSGPPVADAGNFRDGVSSGVGSIPRGGGVPTPFSAAVGRGSELKNGLEGNQEQQNGSAMEGDYSWQNYYDYCVTNYGRPPSWEDYESWYMKTYNRQPVQPEDLRPPSAGQGGGYGYPSEQPPSAYGGARQYGGDHSGDRFGTGGRGGGGSDRFSGRRGGYAGGGERGGGTNRDRERGGDGGGWRDKEVERDGDDGGGTWRRSENPHPEDRGRGGGFGNRDFRGDRGPPSADTERDDWRGGGGHRPPPRGGGGGFDGGSGRDGGARGGGYRAGASAGSDRGPWRDDGGQPGPRGGDGGGGFGGGRRPGPPEGARDGADEGGMWRNAKGRSTGPQRNEQEDGDWQQVNRRR